MCLKKILTFGNHHCHNMDGSLVRLPLYFSFYLFDLGKSMNLFRLIGSRKLVLSVEMKCVHE